LLLRWHLFGLSLLEIEKGIGQTPSQENQPGRQEDQPIGGSVPKGHLVEDLEIDGSQNLGDKVQEGQETDGETEGVPPDTKVTGMGPLVPSNRHKDKDHDETQGNPLKGVDPKVHAAKGEPGHLEGSPPDAIVVFGPIAEIEILDHELTCQHRPNVQKVGDPFRKGSPEGQNHNPGMEPDGTRETRSFFLGQNIDQLKHRKAKEEPCQRSNDPGGNKMGLVFDSKFPFFSDCFRIELFH